MVDPHSLTDGVFDVNANQKFRPSLFVLESRQEQVGGQDADQVVALRLVSFFDVSPEKEIDL